jgi:Transcriptional regulator, AbiEi antitoxin
MAERRLTSHRGTRVDARCDREGARRAGEQWGVLTTSELVACGLTHKAIRSRSHSGQLHRLHTGVWAVGHPELSFEGRMLAALKACGSTAVLSHRSAAGLWGFLDLDERDPEVTVLGRGTRVRPAIVVHRTLTRAARGSTRCRAVPVTNPGSDLARLGRRYRRIQSAPGVARGTRTARRPSDLGSGAAAAGRDTRPPTGSGRSRGGARRLTAPAGKRVDARGLGVPLPCSAGLGPYSVGCEECAVPTSAAMPSSRSTSAR